MPKGKERDNGVFKQKGKHFTFTSTVLEACNASMMNAISVLIFLTCSRNGKRISAIRAFSFHREDKCLNVSDKVNEENIMDQIQVPLQV